MYACAFIFDEALVCSRFNVKKCTMTNDYDALYISDETDLSRTRQTSSCKPKHVFALTGNTLQYHDVISLFALFRGVLRQEITTQLTI